MDLGAQEEDKNMTFWHTEAHHLAAWNMGNVFKN